MRVSRSACRIKAGVSAGRAWTWASVAAIAAAAGTGRCRIRSALPLNGPPSAGTAVASAAAMRASVTGMSAWAWRSRWSTCATASAPHFSSNPAALQGQVNADLAPIERALATLEAQQRAHRAHVFFCARGKGRDGGCGIAGHAGLEKAWNQPRQPQEAARQGHALPAGKKCRDHRK